MEGNKKNQRLVSKKNPFLHTRFSVPYIPYGIQQAGRAVVYGMVSRMEYMEDMERMEYMEYMEQYSTKYST